MIKKLLKHIFRFLLPLFNLSYDHIAYKSNAYRLPKKPGKLAVFTQTNNEGELLLYWEEHYRKLVGYENLYVLNNGGTDSSCTLLNSKTSVVNMPEGLNDLNDAMQIQGYFQRFLLQKYEWVLKVDVDEFMVCNERLLEKLDNLPQGIYSPERAIALIHDQSSEPSFDYSQQLLPQRQIFVEESPAMKKPSLTSVGATWEPGNHTTFEKNNVLPGMWMVHLRYLDFKRLFQRNCRFATLDVTSAVDETTVAFSYLRGKNHDFISQSTADELQRMLSKDHILIPDWLIKNLG
jgi:hypothetical protein